MLSKLGSYSRRNGLANALRELGRAQRTLFTLEWLQSPALRKRVQIGLNKGEARNALSRAVYIHRNGEVRDCRPTAQANRASGLNLVVAAIALWNTVHLQRAVQQLRQQGEDVPDDLMQHVSLGLGAYRADWRLPLGATLADLIQLAETHVSAGKTRSE